MSVDQYEFINVPGMSDVRIPLVKRLSEHEEDSTGVRTPEWMVKINNDRSKTSSTFEDFLEYTELFGFYCESSRHMKGDSSVHLYSSGTLWHSDVFLVTQNGEHTASINQALAEGTIYENIQIIRVSKINGIKSAIQRLIFSDCHWCGVQSYLDWTISRFTACQRENAVTCFKQNGAKRGTNVSITDYVINQSDPK